MGQCRRLANRLLVARMYSSAAAGRPGRGWAGPPHAAGAPGRHELLVAPTAECPPISTGAWNESPAAPSGAAPRARRLDGTDGRRVDCDRDRDSHAGMVLPSEPRQTNERLGGEKEPQGLPSVGASMWRRRLSAAAEPPAASEQAAGCRRPGEGAAAAAKWWIIASPEGPAGGPQTRSGNYPSLARRLASPSGTVTVRVGPPAVTVTGPTAFRRQVSWST